VTVKRIVSTRVEALDPFLSRQLAKIFI